MANVTGQNTKKGAPPCGIYIKIKQTGKSFTLIETLKKICVGLNASPYERNMHVFEYAGKVTDKNKDYITAIKEFLQYQGMVFIINNDIGSAHKIKADGVIVKTPEDVTKARDVLGKDAIIGLRLTSSRRKVEQTLNEDADYISLPLNIKNRAFVPDLIHWWATRTEKPCLVEGNITNNDCKYLVNSGASFIDGSNYVLNHKSGPLQAIVNMLYAIELALPEGTKH